jgi:DNA-binding MarR family transcriptional regulator
MGAEPDVIDRMIADWQAVLPELDASPLAVVGRVIVLARHLERAVEVALKRHKITLGQYDILATLRRHGSEGGLNPTLLYTNLMLTSGGMTSRLDRLEERGLIARQADPTDRRGVVVVLTPKGRKLIDAATITRFENAAESLPPLSKSEIEQLANSLRKWLSSYS